jgi:hypothetical protein
MGGTCEALVAPPAWSATRDYRSLAGAYEIVPGSVLLDQHLRPRRDRQLERLPVCAVAKRSLTVTPATGLEVRAAPEALQVTERVVANEHHVAAAPSVAAVRSTLGDVRLAAETEAAIAPAAGMDVDARTILHAMILTCLIQCS